MSVPKQRLSCPNVDDTDAALTSIAVSTFEIVNYLMMIVRGLSLCLYRDEMPKRGLANIQGWVPAT
jgi:hypothetical protein